MARANALSKRIIECIGRGVFMPLSILIADDHAIVRVGLRTLFQGTNIVVKGEASSGKKSSL